MRKVVDVPRKISVMYDDSIEADMLAIFQPFVETFMVPLLPGWVRRIEVAFHAAEFADAREETDGAMFIRPHYASRDVGVNFEPDWLKMSKDDRIRILRHEAAHVLVGPLAKWIETLINANFDDDEAQRLHDEVYEIEEATVEDISNVIHDLDMPIFSVKLPKERG